MAGLLDAIFPGSSDGGGLLAFLKRNADLQAMPSGLPSDTAQYSDAPQMPGALPAAAPIPLQQNAQPNALDDAPWPSGPIGAPSQANAQLPAPQPQSSAAPVVQPPIAALGAGAPGFMTGYQNLRHGGGLIGSIVAGITGQRNDDQGIALQQQAQTANLTARALMAKGIDPHVAVAAVQPGNGELLKQLVDANFGPGQFSSAGEGHILNGRTGAVTKAYEPEDKTPPSVLEYQYYLKSLPKGAAPMDYATFSTAKARAGATNISNTVDTGAAPAYDKQLVAGLAKSHASLSEGVEEAQARARDVAAMQGAIDAIQRNGGTTGGMGQAQILDLKKTINAGAGALGIENPFNEGDISDKEFLTKFNRQIAGNMAKSAVGGRVTNFEMSNYLKANPGLDMSGTGNQRLLGIQAQIEQRNIAVGNAIREATARAIATGKTINPVEVQKIITDYDEAHHVKDPVTGQDLTQSYVLPEFQQGGTNPALADQHSKNLGKMRRYNPQTGALE
ncbi:hypothetical protein [Bradyrhizobium ivorense]|uniref:hypothetical protein n=1 Tax=Bradyrhizobium ivorense TaxID=2511166 RepID=UPI0010B7C5E0|nr:hypothetical protein [Bradyrhizobium ivorense]VIO73902.1 hypothetical protein CI41S_40110 [Bradyrhizobium ivorense]